MQQGISHTHITGNFQNFRRGGRLCPPLGSVEFAGDFRKKTDFSAGGQGRPPLRALRKQRVIGSVQRKMQRFELVRVDASLAALDFCQRASRQIAAQKLNLRRKLLLREINCKVIFRP